jgi:hypothetical protein
VFFQKWAGRSVRYDRRVRNAEAAGSNPARSTFTPARPHFESPLTLEVILDLKKQGKAEETINGYSRRLRHLAKNTEINDQKKYFFLFILSETFCYIRSQ